MRQHRRLLLLAIAVLAACAPPADFHRAEGATMGTRYRALWSGGAGCDATLSTVLEAELHRVEAQMSTWLPDSELSRFNAAPAGGWVPVSAPLAEVVALALELARRSGGAFDVTVGPLVNLWGFGPERRTAAPTASEIQRAGARVGSALLDLRRSPPAMRKRVDGLTLDLSAIAKGHAVDRLAALLVERGCSDYLVDIGGDLRVLGANADGAAWRIGVESPEARGSGVEQVLALSDGALATSGDYRNVRTIGGRRFGHTIDPRTGRPVDHQLASVTVWAESAALADALATAINVLGPDDGLVFAEQHAIAAMALVYRERGYERRYTGRMHELLATMP